MLSVVSCMMGGIVNMIVVIIVGMCLSLNRIMVGIRYMNVGIVCMKLSSECRIILIWLLCVF